MKTYLKLPFWCFALTLSLGVAFLLAMKSPKTIEKIKSLVFQYFERTQPEIVYVQTDKTLYVVGETIWFQTYIQEVGNQMPSQKSNSVLVELISPNGKSHEKLRLVLKNGSAGGQFDINKDMVGGIYKLKAYTFRQTKDSTTNLFEKEITIQKVMLPRLKMNLEFEKKMYSPNEMVSVTLSLENSQNQALTEQEVSYSVKISAKEYLTKSGKTDNYGKLKIQFNLPDTLKTTDVLLNVTIPFRGVNESIARSIPINLQKIDLQFFAEGGDCIEGLPCSMAFKATGSSNKGVEIAGILKDNTDKEVLTFKNEHFGMGKFYFTPEKGKSYYVETNAQKFPLPNMLKEGSLIQINWDTIRISSNSSSKKLYLIGRIGNQFFVEKEITNLKGTKTFSFLELTKATKQMGVAYFTLFDEKLIPLAERLVFLNPLQELKINLRTDKRQYEPREEVNLSIETTDYQGNPIPAHLSVSVVDDKLLSFINDKQANILPSLLLAPHIKGEIEDPNFYFTKTGKFLNAIDLLLLTQGWRKFEYEDIPKLPSLAPFIGDTVLSGKFLKMDEFGKPVPFVGSFSIYKDAWWGKHNSFGFTKELIVSTDLNGIFSVLSIPFDISKNERFPIYVDNESFVAKYGDNIELQLYKSLQNLLFPQEIQDFQVTYQLLYSPKTKKTRWKAKSLLMFFPAERNPGGYFRNIAYFDIEELKKQFKQIPHTYWVNPFNPIYRMGMIDAIEYQLFDSYLEYIKHPYGGVEFFPELSEIYDCSDIKDFLGCQKFDSCYKTTQYEFNKQKLSQYLDLFGEQRKSVEDLEVLNSLSKEKVNNAFENLKRNSIRPQQKEEIVITEKHEYINFKFCANQPFHEYKRELGRIIIELVKQGKIKPYTNDSLNTVHTVSEFIQNMVIPSYEDAGDDIFGGGRGDDWGGGGGWGDDGSQTNTSSSTKIVTNRNVENNNSPSENKSFTLENLMYVPDILSNENYDASRPYYKKVFPNSPKKPLLEGEVRTDFRKTIFWQGDVVTDENGKAQVKFWNNDDITSFRIIAEGWGNQLIGHQELAYFTAKNLSLDTKTPPIVQRGDKMEVPVTINNQSAEKMNVEIKAVLLGQFGFVKEFPTINLQLTAKQSNTVFYPLSIFEKEGNYQLKWIVQDLEKSKQDIVFEDIKVINSGYPVHTSYSGSQKEDSFVLKTLNVVDSTLEVSFIAYPSLLSNFLSGLEGILKEPSGCFEQVSSTTYPNILVLNAMNNFRIGNNSVKNHAINLIIDGYKRLISFETSQGGFEWFGKTPPNLILTSYGLLEFSDMNKVVPNLVDSSMIKRTTNWILNQRDFKSGFIQKNNWNSPHITNLYVLYSLTNSNILKDLYYIEGLNPDFTNEINIHFDSSLLSNDSYSMALMLNILPKVNNKEEEYEKLIKILFDYQNFNGSWRGLESPFSYDGIGLTIETTSLVILGLLEHKAFSLSELSNNDNYFVKIRSSVEKGIQFILQQRSVMGTYGNCHSTVLTLKALLKYQQMMNAYLPKSDGAFEILMNDKSVQKSVYSLKDVNKIIINNLDAQLVSDKNNIRVKFLENSSPIPYTFRASWQTNLPPSQPECKVEITSSFSNSSVKLGDVLRLNNVISNKTKEDLPMTVALIGIPSGVSVQSWQLKEYQDKGFFDYYEIIDNKVVFYWRTLAPSQSISIPLDLKSEVIGEYSSPASSAYLYYVNEYRNWTNAGKVKVEK